MFWLLCIYFLILVKFGIRILNRMLRNIRLPPRYKWDFRSSEMRRIWFICLLCSSSPFSLFPLSLIYFFLLFFVFSPLRPHFLHLVMASCSGPDFPQSTPEATRLYSCPSPPIALQYQYQLAWRSLRTNHCAHHSLYNCLPKCSRHFTILKLPWQRFH